MNIKAFFAILLCKALRLVSRVLHKGGTAMPGRFALKLCPNLLEILSKNVKSVAVTGTNGKTTTVRMMESAMEEAGLSYFSNRSGANLISGIVTEYVMNCTLTGKMKKEYCVIECDEAAAKKVFPQMQPRVIIVTNLFRDQLDRYGTTENTLAAICAGIGGSPESVVCLNADDPVTSVIASRLQNKAVFFGMDAGALKSSGTVELGGLDKCLVCGAKLQYDYINYAHLGGYRCPKCGRCRPKADIAVKDVVSQELTGTTAVFDIKGKRQLVNVSVAGLYNVCNAAAAIAAAEALGIDTDTAVKAIENCECSFGRMERFALGQQGSTMMLVKNSAGCNQVIDFIKNFKGHFSVALAINNRVPDGTDISWLDDSDFESLAAMPGLDRIFVSGERMKETAERLIRAGTDEKRITKEADYKALVELIAKENVPVFLMPNYTAMIDFRAAIIDKVGGKEFWE